MLHFTKETAVAMKLEGKQHKHKVYYSAEKINPTYNETTFMKR